MAMTIEVEDAEAEKALRNAARTLSRKFKIPGFRPGKAPYNVVVRLLGIEAVQEQAVEELGQKLYKQALEEKGIEPYASASLDEVTWNPLTLRLTIPMPPRVDLGAYRDVRLPPEEVVVTDEQINQVLENIRKQNAMWQPVERPARLGDMITADIEATVGGQVVLKNEGREMILREDSRYPVPGFGQALVGMQPGEEKTFELPYPEDYYNRELAGQQATFHVLMDTIKEEVLPPVDDALAMSAGYESLDLLREDIRAELLEQAQREANNRFVTTVMDRVVEGATVAFPPIMLEHEIDDMVKEQQQRLEQRGMSLEEFLKLRGQTEEDFRQELRPYAEKRLRQSLVLGGVVQAERLSVESSEIDEQIASLALSLDEEDDDLKEFLFSPLGKLSVGSDMLTRRALERLVAIAQGKAPELLPESEESVADTSTSDQREE
jgi:trigger factor